MVMLGIPTQNEIDRVAIYVEAARELQHEPFFGKDENRKMSWQGSHYTYELGDRFHFRSALVTFRRIWMTKEPSHFYSCYNVLARYCDDGERAFLNSWRESIRNIEDSFVIVPGIGQINDIKNRNLVDLWLNAVFAHVSIKPVDNKRKEFEKLLMRIGQGPLEYAFRVVVWQLGLQYQNMSKIHAEHFLRNWEKSNQLLPSISIGAPFGIRRKEITPEGHTIIRRASTKYYGLESVETMLQRICGRQNNSDIHFLTSHLEVPFSEIAKRLLCASCIEDLIKSLGGELKIVDHAVLDGNFPGTGARSFTSLHDKETKVISKLLIQGQSIVTTEVGRDVLNKSLKSLLDEFKNELAEDD